EAHYAPATPVALVAAADLPAIVARLHAAGRRAALIHYTGKTGDVAEAAARLALPADPAGYAHGLYAALRTMDGARADVILVERPPAGSAWQGVNDRLRRAAHDSRGALDALL
ncbi:MAG: Sua5 family C-terminal domain-containing protein, partial [Burkholderiaceae bacterium]